MTENDFAALFDALDATWPSEALESIGSFVIGRDTGGGQRVSSARLPGNFDPIELAAAIGHFERAGRLPLFQVRPGQTALDDALASAGFRRHDATRLLVRNSIDAGPPPRSGAIPAWPPLAIMREIWSAGGIGAGRLAVMDRASTPRTCLLGRDRDTPAGACFVSVAGKIAMIHALEVAPPSRRCGVARRLVEGAARWAANMGAESLAAAVLSNNAPAQALFSSLGFVDVAGYHYRIAPRMGKDRQDRSKTP